MPNDFISCPADCDTEFVFPAIPVDQSCSTYEQPFSQVCDLVIQPTGAAAPFDFTTPATPTVVSSEIDNTDATNAKSKHLVGEGGVAVPEKDIGEYPKRQTRITNRVYTLVLNIKNLSDSMYEFLRGLQCGPTNFTFYYGTVGGRLFGPDGGIEPSSIDVDLPLGEGRDDKEIGTITITWDADGDPDRGANPL
jgi:hypothetical protein